MAQAVTLTIKSINNSNLAADRTGLFEVSKLGVMYANLNPATAVTVTPNSALGTSSWALYFPKGVEVPTKLYFTVTDLGSTNTVSLYKDSGLTALVAKTDTAVSDGAVATLVEKNESGITGKVTLAGSNTGNSYVTIANYAASKSLALNGETEFVYQEGEVWTKYTVAETVAEIEALINPAS